MSLKEFIKGFFKAFLHVFGEPFLRIVDIRFEKIKLLHSQFRIEKKKYSDNDNYIIELCKINLQSTIDRFEKDPDRWIAPIKLRKLNELNSIFHKSPNIIIKYFNKQKLSWNEYKAIQEEHAETFKNKANLISSDINQNIQLTNKEIIQHVIKWINSTKFKKWQLIIIGSVLYDLNVIFKTKDDNIPERLGNWGEIININLSYNNRISKTFDISDTNKDQKKLRLLLVELHNQFEKISYSDGRKYINEIISKIDKKISQRTQIT